MKRFVILLALLLASSAIQAQESARQKVVAGAALVDQGKYDEALKLLREGAAMEPDNYHWAYEVAFAYYSKKDYKIATQEFEKVVSMPGADAQCYAMLGNCYDYSGDTAKAWATYEAGLKKFPESGHLLVEMGHMQKNRKAYGKALTYYESGLKHDPAVTSNFFWAAIIYLASDFKVWGMIYGEAFMNLERNSQRTAQMSKLLFDTYRESIHVTSDTSLEVTFEKNVIDADDLLDKNGALRIPFAMKVYEPMMLMATLFSGKTTDMEGLVAIRTSFLDLYYKQGLHKEYPNRLLEYQKKVADAGHAAAYHHWILMKGDEDGFGRWASGHKNEWEAFTTWFAENKMFIHPEQPLVRD